MKFYAIKIFHAQQQRKDGKEAKFMAEKNMNFQHFEQVPNKNSHQKYKEETEDRILCSSDKHQVPRKSRILSLLCYFIIFYYIMPQNKFLN